MFYLMRKSLCLGIAILYLVLAGCSSLPAVQSDAVRPLAHLDAAVQQVPVSISATMLDQPRTCSNTFVTHGLDHTTSTHGNEVHLFESNGAGVAVNDLDGDGWLDVVMANLNGPATILWNLGNLDFQKQTLADENTRAVNIVDVDGDGKLDIVFTHTASSLSYWRNLGKGTDPARAAFVRTTLPGVLKPAHSMAWGDLSVGDANQGDNALDLVTGSYDADLHLTQGNTFLFGDGAGVWYYEHDGERFEPQRLAKQAQALTISLYDVDGDARPDIRVGNDFDMRDQVWLRDGNSWQSASPFAVTSESTMSFDAADIDNDGSLEFFSADMKPFGIDVGTLAAWLPIMAKMPPVHAAGDPQVMQNVLLKRSDDGSYRDLAVERGVDATGWSWSSKFGDLDNDGWLDLYVVNGMIAQELFPFLPGNQLIEENQALRNQGGGTFMAEPAWGLGSTASGRGMSMADLDKDGDLDIVVNNLRAPAQLFENQLCGGASLEVDLNWKASRNRRALGAQLLLRTDKGNYLRDVRAGSGYLSGDPARLHFGFPSDAVLQELVIRWPDGARSTVQTPHANSLLTIAR